MQEAFADVRRDAAKLRRVSVRGRLLVAVLREVISI